MYIYIPPFRPFAVLGRVVVLLEMLRLFVHRVVGQVHVAVLDALFRRVGCLWEKGIIHKATIRFLKSR